MRRCAPTARCRWTRPPSVLHYGQEIFEGIKAYRHADGSIWTFRPDANGARLQRSAARLVLPQLPVSEFVESLRQLVAIDGDWVPSAPETSLYFRPFMIATEAFLGVRAAQKAGYYVIASPAGAYFAKGVAPVSIWLSEDYARCSRVAPARRSAATMPPAAAAAGSAGAGLLAGAVSIRWKASTGRAGRHERVPRLQGRPHRHPELSGSILEGITRDSILQIARDRGHAVEERKVSIDEWKQGVTSGDIVEVPPAAPPR